MKTLLQRLCFVFVVFVSTGCTSLLGSFDGELYRSPDVEFQVTAPAPGMAPSDGKFDGAMYFVDFEAFRHYWMIGGLYSVAWFVVPKPFESDEHYLESTQAFFPDYIESRVGAPSGSVAITEEKPMVVDGRRAYRVVATGTRDGIPILFILTSIDFGDRIGVAQLLTPRELAGSEVDVPWEKYERFVASVERQAPASD